jgi:peroxiredoxin Q/BCP
MRKLSALLFAIVLICSTFAVAQTAAPAAPAPDNTPKVGDLAPAIKLDSNEGTAVSLSDYKGKWVVLYFYPKDFTGG